VADERQFLFTVATPLQSAQTVVCYHDTWEIHLPATRRDLGTQIVMDTLSAPTVILQGTTNQGYVVFLNQALTSASSKSPFAVIVDPEGNPLPAVASFGFRRDFTDLSGHSVLWLPPADIDPSGRK
jgi:hypothetical protein